MATEFTIIVEEDINSVEVHKILSDFEEIIAGKYDLTLYDSHYTKKVVQNLNLSRRETI